MISIYLCEDDAEQLQRLKELIMKTLLFIDQDISLRCAVQNPYQLLQQLEGTTETGLYFLDIDLKSDMDGLALAQKIRQHDSRGYIVFITTHSEMAALTFTYKIEAMDFIIKDDFDALFEKIQSCIQAALLRETASKEQNNRLVTFKINGTMLRLDPHDIILIQSDSVPHKLTLHTIQSVKQFSGSLKEMEPVLNSRFCRCHSSTIINLDHVHSLHPIKRMVEMDNGETCSVSVRMLPAVRTALTEKTQNK